MSVTSAEPRRQALWSAGFRREREASWRELDRLVRTVEARGVRSLNATDVARLPVLYRATLSSLSVARAVCLDRNLLEYLEALTARAYLCVYGPRRRFFAVLVDFLRRRFPAAVRTAAPQIALSGISTLVGILVAFVLVRGDLDLYWHFVDDSMSQGRDPTATTEFLRQTLFDEDGKKGFFLATFAAFLASHNSLVVLLAFGLGFLAGVPALLLLFITGAMLGAMSALYHSRGLGLEWWSWILPHGITEVSAVVLCGGAGLVLADSMIFPGRHGRLHELARRGREAGVIVLGAIGMLFVAGTIEGIFRQVVHDISLRYGLAALTATFWLSYFGFAGRSKTS